MLTFRHEAGCPKMTAAGDPPCTCGTRAGFEQWLRRNLPRLSSDARIDDLREAYMAGWFDSKRPTHSYAPNESPSQGGGK